jgi:LmbE family N-acetylglucosaminyl deacetylase
MVLAHRLPRIAACAALATLFTAPLATAQQTVAQQPVRRDAPYFTEPSSVALPIPENRGAAALDQSLRRLSTTASVMMIVAHPDDEDGALLAYLSRSLGARCILLTLTRGEGGQNAMSGETYDALGLIRTNELLKAGEYYGVKQLWGTEIDFGFSKTQEEAFARWGHDRVLYDAVLAVRRERPQVIVSTFVGGVTDGHGHHQVSGEIAQEVFKAAADPSVFPEQLKPASEGGLGLTVWQPLAVYSMTPFAPVTGGKMFDYATGKWAPAQFKNYVTGEVTAGVPSSDVTIQVGTRAPAIGRSYAQIAREGWGMQKSQNGGANPSLSGPASTSYHLWAVAPEAAAKPGAITTNDDLFHNSRVNIDASIAGLAGSPARAELSSKLHAIENAVKLAESKCPCHDGPAAARELAPAYHQTLDLRAEAASTDLDPQAKASVLFELDTKIDEFQSALKNLLGLDLTAFTTKSSNAQETGGFRGGGPDETPRSVSPGEEFNVRIHTSRSGDDVHLARTWLVSQTGSDWPHGDALSSNSTGSTTDVIYKIKVPDDAQPTQPYFTRPNIEQAYYDLAQPEYRERSFAPWPLAAWAEFTFDGLPIRVGEVVQTMQRVLGPGGVYEPLVVTPAIGVRMEPEARILPLDGSPLPVRVTVHAQAAAEGSVALTLPAGWTAQPASAPFHLSTAGDTEPIQFLVTPGAQSSTQSSLQTIQAVAEAPRPGNTTAGDPAGSCALSSGVCATYKSGWQSVGYPGLRPYNLYRPAQLLTRKVDVKLASNLRIGYIMGTGDDVPDAIEALGAMPHILTPAEINSSDFSTWNVLVVGIRAYSALPALAAAQPRLNQFVQGGGTLIVQYQSANFPAPIPLSLGHAERVVDESDAVKLIAPENSLLTTPNKITSADFDGWVEERGHSFLESWDPAYTPLTETADPGQDPQQGGMVVAHPGKGTYIYVAYALHRQLSELVPGAYRILANLLSANQSSSK